MEDSYSLRAAMARPFVVVKYYTPCFSLSVVKMKMCRGAKAGDAKLQASPTGENDNTDTVTVELGGTIGRSATELLRRVSQPPQDAFVKGSNPLQKPPTPVDVASNFVENQQRSKESQQELESFDESVVAVSSKYKDLHKAVWKAAHGIWVFNTITLYKGSSRRTSYHARGVVSIPKERGAGIQPYDGKE